MGQFSRDLMVIAFLGGHIAFHPVQCVRPIYQSSSLSRALSDKGGCQGRGGRRGCSDEKERARENIRECVGHFTARERERETIQRREERGKPPRREEERCRPRSYRKSLRSRAQQSARWSCPARLQTGSGRGVAAELNYYKLPRHSYRMHAPAGARKSSTLRQPSTSRAACERLMLLSFGLSANWITRVRVAHWRGVKWFSPH